MAEETDGGFVVEGGIAKSPAGRMPAQAAADAEKAWSRRPEKVVLKLDASTSLRELAAMELPPGATVLFKRGCVWRGQLRAASGIPGHPVTYGAWGEGPAPVLQPSLDRSDPAAWSRESDGLWRCAAGAGSDIGNVVLDGGADGCLFRRASRADLLRDRDYWFDAAADAVYVRSDRGHPAERWRSVELCEKIHAVDEACAHDVVYEGLTLRYSAAHGIGGGGVKRVSVRNCEISWIGGGYLYVDTHGNGVRYGNGIELWGGAEDVAVEGCTVRECWDAGLTNQTNEPGSVQRNVLWRGNRVENCEYSYEFWHQGEGGVAENILFEDNDCRDAGGGWGHAQRWNPNAAHLMLYDTVLHTPGFVVRGNAFRRSADVLCRMFNDWRGEAVFEGNVWESGGEPFCRFHGRPRSGLRHLYPDRLDQIHCDDASEIESQGGGARLFAKSFPLEATADAGA